ncbi:MAG TPA: hypothetical protein VLV54_04495 [Thermoanaerobaculia bacterium]|nr:hypothetical protein [Thermoanaerobaculia bacterium]
MRVTAQMSVLGLAVLLLAASWSLSADPAPTAADAFSRLKSLEGEWQGVSAKGKKVHLSFVPIAGGTAMMETFKWEGSSQAMTTVYHLDGDSLMLTHYCISNNQPRMRAHLPGDQANVLKFDFLDMTNQKAAGDGHMHQAVIRFIDKDHIANAWTFYQNGKEAFTETGEYERLR